MPVTAGPYTIVPKPSQTLVRDDIIPIRVQAGDPGRHPVARRYCAMKWWAQVFDLVPRLQPGNA